LDEKIGCYQVTLQLNSGCRVIFHLKEEKEEEWKNKLSELFRKKDILNAEPIELKFMRVIYTGLQKSILYNEGQIRPEQISMWGMKETYLDAMTESREIVN